MKANKFVFLTIVIFLGLVTPSFAEQALDYKKFGRIATAVVVEDYPEEKVVDYKYEGRKQTNESMVVDSFRFKVMDNGKEKFVTVRITHDNLAGKELTITLTEEK